MYMLINDISKQPFTIYYAIISECMQWYKYDCLIVHSLNKSLLSTYLVLLDMLDG